MGLQSVIYEKTSVFHALSNDMTGFALRQKIIFFHFFFKILSFLVITPEIWHGFEPNQRGWAANDIKYHWCENYQNGFSSFCNMQENLHFKKNTLIFFTPPFFIQFESKLGQNIAQQVYFLSWFYSYLLSLTLSDPQISS